MRATHVELALTRGGSARADASVGLLQLIRDRQNVSARRLLAPGPDASQLDAMLEAAAAAPDHGRLLPYRFILVPRSQRWRLAEAFCLALIDRAPDATLEQIEAAREKAYRAPVLLLAVVDAGERDLSGIPAIEKVVAAGCAIQNLLLAAGAAGFGSGLSSGRAMDSARLRDLFALRADERAVCFVGIGTVVDARPVRLRPGARAILTAL